MKTYIRLFVLAVLFGSVASAQVSPAAQSQNPQQQPAPAGPPGPPNPLLIPVPKFAETRNVPHGELRVVWFNSKAFGEQRRMHVYLPPGYEQGKTKYPVLYLIHGGGGDDATWTLFGRTQFILDNLLAEGKVKPMIVVMPNGFSMDPAMMRPPGPDNRQQDFAARAAGAAKIRDTFIDDLLGGIIPYVETNYRAQSNRAIIGFSYGGAESLWVGVGHPDKFAWIGVFSMGIQGGSTAGAGSVSGSGSAETPAEFVKQHAAFFADSAKTNQSVKLFWIGVGKEDGVVGSGPRQLADTLAVHGIHHEFHETDGGHTLGNWQDYLRDFAPKLFR